MSERRFPKRSPRRHLHIKRVDGEIVEIVKEEKLGPGKLQFGGVTLDVLCASVQVPLYRKGRNA